MTRHLWGVLLVAGVSSSWARADDIPAAELFKVLDKNGDGRLVTEEIPEGQYRFFERVLRQGDQNQDGAITLNEFQNVMQANAVEKPAAPPGPVITEKVSPPVVFPDSPAPSSPSPGGKPATEPASTSAQTSAQVLSRLDRNGDGKLERSELPKDFADRLEPIFQKFQSDAITIDQILSSLSLIQQREPTSEKATTPPSPPNPAARVAGSEIRFLRWLDRDNNGTLSREEIANAAAVFQHLDTNGDGQLDVNELIHAGPLPPTSAPPTTSSGSIDFEALFSRIDRNRDGAISLEEAPERIQRLFPLVDENGDGQLSPEELRAGLEQMRKQPANEPRPQ